MNFMNAKEIRETTDPSLVIEDLSVKNAEAIKGGDRQAMLKMLTEG
jgi:hypothetical protein